EFADDTNDLAQLKKGLYFLGQEISRKLRLKKKHGAAMTITLSYSDGIQSKATTKITPPTAHELILFKKLIPLLYKAWKRRTRIRHMRLVCDKLTAPEVQMDIFSNKAKIQKQRHLALTMENIRQRFGKNAIKPGLALVA
ncbi:MAG: hypothetical protein GY729_22505, partial [Desulfobacteraceae bacterium]|nr:hypothetical protein [Desulfobacteraceae bacterium]